MDIQKLLDEAKEEFEPFLHAAEEAERYYKNEGRILQTGAAAIDEVNRYLKKLGKNPLRSADNRISSNWHRILTDQKVGYLFTYPPQFDVKFMQDGKSKNEDSIPAKIMDVLGDDYPKVIRQLGTDATNAGRAWLTYWYQENSFGKKGKFQYYFVCPMQVIPIYDPDSLKPRLKELIRRYTVRQNGCEITKCEHWTDKNVTYYENKGSGYQKLRVVKHTYGEIPFIEFRNNASAIGDLKMYRHLIDAIDRLISGFANDIDDLQEIIWVIKNYAGEQSTVDYNEKTGEEVEKSIDIMQKIKAQKYLFVDGNGGLEPIRGDVPYEARSKFLDILIAQLYTSAMAVNPSPENTGDPSGVYIEFLYSLMELKAGLMETEFRPSLNCFLRAILRYLGESDTIQIEQVWTRNKPRNDLELSKIIMQTPNTVLSDETKTKAHPLAENWITEREQIAAEQKMRMVNMLEEFGDVHKAGGEE